MGGVRARLVVGAANEVSWRLCAGNGRVLGVSVRGFPDDAAACADLFEVVAVAARLVGQIAHPQSSVDWQWVALDDSGLAVATGLRPYARYGTCVASFGRFRDAAATVARAGVLDTPGAVRCR